ncbi:MAG TPA: PEP-CTERM sorting domain-containing protein [Armatimonadota bacterium]|nr:PEP-CTERM sorting domain-containing protein [Armatimonadota bacterium]
MKRLLILAAIAAMLAVLSTCVGAAGWQTFVIRNASDGSAPAINDVVVGGVNAKEFVITKGSQKAGWGTSDLDGNTIGDILAISVDRLDDYTRFTGGSGPAVGPYINIWITNGAGKYAVIANEPSNAEWQPGNQQWDMTWDTLKTKTLKVYENSDMSWLPNAGVGLKFQDIADFVIQAPTVAELTTGWTGLGGGAPREYGTNVAYGFNWVFGDTLSNYVSGNPGYIIANPVATTVPEPMSMTVLGLGLAGLIARRRKSA